MVEGHHSPLILGEMFDGVSAEGHLVMMRNAGWMPAVVVVGSGHGPLPEIAESLAPVSIVRDPVCNSSPASNPWLRRCIEAVKLQPPGRSHAELIRQF